MGEGDADPVGLMPRLREALDEAGRDASRFEVSIYFCPPDPATVERIRDAGMNRVLFAMPSAPRDEALRRLDELSALTG